MRGASGRGSGGVETASATEAEWSAASSGGASGAGALSPGEGGASSAGPSLCTRGAVDRRASSSLPSTISTSVTFSGTGSRTRNQSAPQIASTSSTRCRIPDIAAPRCTAYSVCLGWSCTIAIAPKSALRTSASTC